MRAILPLAESATSHPTLFAVVSPPVSFFPCCLQVEEVLAKIQAAPALSSSRGPPIRAS